MAEPKKLTLSKNLKLTSMGFTRNASPFLPIINNTRNHDQIMKTMDCEHQLDQLDRGFDETYSEISSLIKTQKEALLLGQNSLSYYHRKQD